MKRRDMLLTSGAAVLSLSSFPLGWVAAAEKKKQKLLYFTRSVGYEHSVVAPKGDAPSHSEKILTELGKKAGFELECTKDGRVFDRDLEDPAHDAPGSPTAGQSGCRRQAAGGNPLGLLLG